jgi:hypothetical protein
MLTVPEYSPESLAQGVLESVFARNPSGSHELANLVRDAGDSVGARTKEERAAIAELMLEGLAELEADGTIMRDRRAGRAAWMLGSPSLTDASRDPGLRTRADDLASTSA